MNKKVDNQLTISLILA